MSYVEPRVSILQVDEIATGCRLIIQLPADAHRPFSPASLFFEQDPSEAVINLARLVQLDGVAATFEADERPRQALPVGAILIFRPWWSLDQLAIAHGSDRPWRLIQFQPQDALWRGNDGQTKVIPRGWDHEHCCLCWATIHAQEMVYFDGSEWLCPACFERYLTNGRGSRLGDRD